MKLHESIEEILIKSRKPLSISEITDIINNNKTYTKKDESLISKSQISARIRQYEKIFQRVNDLVFLTSNSYWREIITTYYYITSYLRGTFQMSDIQYVAAYMFYKKRISDCRNFNSYYERWYNYLSFGLTKDSLYYDDYDVISLANIQSEYLSLMKKMSNEKIIELEQIINRIDTSIFNEIEFGNIYEYLIHLNSNDSKRTPIINTPYSLKKLLVGLLNPEEGALILDPVCGTSGCLIDLDTESHKNLSISGFEKNHRVSLLSVMNLHMNNCYEVKISNIDCFDKVYDEIKFDYMIADLPLNSTVSNKIVDYFSNSFNLQLENIKSVEAFILFIITKLKQNGKAVFTLPEGFLIKNGRERIIRKFLVENDFVESIIALPAGTLRPQTEALASIMIINLNKEIKKKIKFIRATSISGDKLSIDINYDEIISLNEFSSYSKENINIVDNSDLHIDYNLSAYTYDEEYFLTNKMLSDNSGKLLTDLVVFRTGITLDKNLQFAQGETCYVKIENLNRDILSVYLENKSLNKINVSYRYEKQIIKQECLLIARIGDNLKVTFFRPTSVLPEIILHNGVIGLFAKDDKIDLEYLYYQLNSAFINDQLKKVRVGSIMPLINVGKLRNIIVPYLDYSSQLEFVKTQKANIISSERAKIEEKIKALGYKEEKEQAETDIVRTLVHQLRPTLLNINQEVKNIQVIVNENDFTKLKSKKEDFNVDAEIEHIIVKPKDYTLGELLDKLLDDSIKINEVLSIVNKVMSFKLEAKDFEKVELFSFFNEYFKSKEIEINNIIFNVTGNQVQVYINKSSFIELIDQLILNAQKHGFVEKHISENKISINIKHNKERNVAIIEYQNNGKAFTLSQKDYFSPFTKSQHSNGSGIGGNFIFRIIEAHKGDIIVKENLKTGFQIVIEIPIKTTFENE